MFRKSNFTNIFQTAGVEVCVKSVNIPETSDSVVSFMLYQNQINAHALIGQSAMVYCAGNGNFACLLINHL